MAQEQPKRRSFNADSWTGDDRAQMQRAFAPIVCAGATYSVRERGDLRTTRQSIEMRVLEVSFALVKCTSLFP